MDLLYHLAEFIDPNPVEYIRLAAVSKTWYTFFMSDYLWRYINPHAHPNHLAAHFLQTAKSIPKADLILHWYSKPSPATAYLPGEPYCMLGLLANYIPRDYFREIISFYISGETLMLCGIRLNPHSLQCAVYDLRDSPNCVLAAVSSAGCALRYASSRIKNSPTIVYKAIKVGCPDTCPLHAGRDLPIQYASSSLRRDINFARKVVAISGRSLKYFSRYIRRDRSIALLAIESDPKAIKYTPLRREDSIAFLALILCGDNLRYLPQFQDNNHMVELAVSHRGEALQFASPRLRNDPKIVARAVENGPFAICFASYQVQRDFSIALLAVSINGLVLEVLPHWSNNRVIVHTAVAQNPAALQYASKSLQHSVVFILGTLEKNVRILNYLHPSLCNNPTIAYAAANIDFLQTVCFLDAWWMHSKDLVMLGIQSTPQAFHMASRTLWKDPDVRRTYLLHYPNHKMASLSRQSY